MSYDNESTDMRIALWHEAGHAVAAMSMGLKIKSLGLNPTPHCLVDHKGAASDDIGVLLCAGAMMTSHVYGIEWGSETDYAMAASIGDLSAFREKALVLVTENCAKGRTIVDLLARGTAASGDNLVARYGNKLFLADDHCLYYPEAPSTTLCPDSADYAELEAMVIKTAPSGVTVKAIKAMEFLNINYPTAMAKLAAVSAMRWGKSLRKETRREGVCR